MKNSVRTIKVFMVPSFMEYRQKIYKYKNIRIYSYKKWEKFIPTTYY